MHVRVRLRTRVRVRVRVHVRVRVRVRARVLPLGDRHRPSDHGGECRASATGPATGNWGGAVRRAFERPIP